MTLPDLPDLPGLSSGQFQGLPVLHVTTPFATAAISLFGGQLLSFVPSGGRDLLWLSPLAKQPPTPIRGGIPLCWPYFGRQDQSADVPAHGIARTAAWHLLEGDSEPDGSVRLLLAPASPLPSALSVRQELRIGRQLEQRLISENTGDVPLRLTQALHSYFQVGDALRVDVDGLDGLDYLDKYQNYALSHRQHGDWNLRDPRDPGRSDRIYTGAGGPYRLTDPLLGRRITITSQGSASLVVWNPGEQGAQALADVGQHWRQYVCLEVANAGPDQIELAPGARHCLGQILSCQPL